MTFEEYTRHIGWSLTVGRRRALQTARAPALHRAGRCFARGFGRDSRALPQLVAAACQVGGLGGVARQFDGFVVRRARLSDCGPAGAIGRRGSHGRRDSRPTCPQDGGRPPVPPPGRQARVRGHGRPPERLADAIRRVAAGQRVVDPALAATTLAAGASPLTARERDVLVAARPGATVAEIARSCGRSS